MEKILITYTNQGKNTAEKIQQTLKKAGFRSTLGHIGQTENSDMPEAVIPVITQDSCDDDTMSATLRLCEKQNITVVPYIAEKMPENILTDFFLDEHIWIDAHTQSENSALADTADLFKRNHKELTKPATKKKDEYNKKPAAATQTPQNQKKTKQTPENQQTYKNLFYISLAVILVLLFILINGGIKQENHEASMQQANLTNSLGNSNIKIDLSSELRKSETALVGHWQMTNYSDNQFRPTREDSATMQTMINTLISRAQLIFNADKTFSRLGFAADTETGTWEYDPQSKYLKLKPTDVNQYDIVQIQEITPEQMILVVTEKVENNSIITKMTFTKIN